MAESTYLDAELYVPSPDRARFSWGGREYEGEPRLGEDRLLDVRELEFEPERYGALLFDSVFPPGSALRQGLREAMLEVERTKRRLHFHLHLSPSLPDRIHAAFWELLFDPEHRLALARSPDTAFSRYGALSRAPGVPAAARPRLLCVVAAPSDLERYRMAPIDREEILRHFAAAVAELAEEIEVAVLEPPATLSRLRDRLVAGGGFHLLHIFGHGSSQSRGGSALVLEDDQGKARFVDEQLLAETFLGDRELRLVTLIACHGGAPSSSEVFSGLAGRLVERGIPAVLAMRRAVSVAHAKVFTSHLYRHIARTGQVDAAVNEARQQLFLAEPKAIAWSSPVLFQRLADGRLWLPAEEAEAAAASGRGARWAPSWRRLRHPLPWVPALLGLLVLAAAFRPAPRAEVEMDLRVSGLSFRLAGSNALLGAELPLERIGSVDLAALQLPSTVEPPPFSPRGKSFFLQKGDGPDSHLSLQGPRLLPKGTEVQLLHPDGESYHRLGLSRSTERFTVTVQGDLALKALRRPAIPLSFANVDSLVLTPRKGTLDLDLYFASFPEKAFAAEIPVDRLRFDRIEEEQTTQDAQVHRESTLQGGEVRVRAGGRKFALRSGESLTYASAEGSLAGLQVGPQGFRFVWRGRVSGLTRKATGGPAENLMPSFLDLAVQPASQPLLARLFVILGAAIPALAVALPGTPRRFRRTA